MSSGPAISADEYMALQKKVSDVLQNNLVFLLLFKNGWDEIHHGTLMHGF